MPDRQNTFYFIPLITVEVRQTDGKTHFISPPYLHQCKTDRQTNTLHFISLLILGSE